MNGQSDSRNRWGPFQRNFLSFPASIRNKTMMQCLQCGDVAATRRCNYANAASPRHNDLNRKYSVLCKYH